MIDYTELVSPLYPDDTVMYFVIDSVKLLKIADPEDDNPDKKARRKVQALMVSFKTKAPTGDEGQIVDLIRITKNWINRLDQLRTATGEEIKSRIFDEKLLIGRDGFLSLTLSTNRNYVGRFLPRSEGEAAFSEQMAAAEKQKQEGGSTESK
jgi:hypothetical protein